MSEPLDIAGIGIGPFNLSLAALLEPVPGLCAQFFERKRTFSWHQGQLLPATRLQTSFLKDLVTPVDPTSRHSFLAYLVEKGRFYEFVHAGQAAVSRAEFADYLAWVAGRLGSLRFAASVDAIDVEDGAFRLRGSFGQVLARNLALATGREPALPAWAGALVGQRFFHVSRLLHERPDVAGLRVAIVGGGQSGAEAFLGLARDLFGRARSLTWISRRMGFSPLDETHLTNEWFTPGYVQAFHALPARAPAAPPAGPAPGERWDLALDARRNLSAALRTTASRPRRRALQAAARARGAGGTRPAAIHAGARDGSTARRDADPAHLLMASRFEAAVTRHPAPLSNRTATARTVCRLDSSFGCLGGGCGLH